MSAASGGLASFAGEYQRMLRFRPTARLVPELAVASKDAALRLSRYPDPNDRSHSALFGVAGEAAHQIFTMTKGFMTADAGVELFWVAEEMCDLVEAAAKQLPGNCVAMDAVSHPVGHGFVVFEKPVLSWVSEDPGLGPVPISGLAWGGVPTQQWDGDTARTGVLVIPLGPPMAALSSTGLLPLSCSWLFPDHSLDEHVDNRYLRAATPNHDPDDPDYLESDENRRLLVALLILLGSTVVSSEGRGLIDRAARRRAQRANVPSDVRIVRLRRSQGTHEVGEESAPVEWSHRWIVSGHWRNQRVGKGRAEQRLTWIAPHIKGPDDKPLVIRPTVGALVR